MIKEKFNLTEEMCIRDRYYGGYPEYIKNRC